MNRRSRHLNRGMTAIELLVAATLSTMLLISVLALLASLHRQKDFLYKQTTDRGWEQMVAALQRDFANSRILQADPTRIEFDGYGGSESGPYAAINIRARIAYEIQAVGALSWLVRTEYHPDSAAVSQQRQLVCEGISFLDLLYFEPRSRSWISYNRSPTKGKRIDSPGQLRLLAYAFDGTGQPKLLVDEMLVRHGVVE